MAAYYSEHTKYFVSVDCIIFGFDDNKLKLLLGKRQMDPGRGEWSLYGGFVEPHENLDQCANRALYSLTGLKDIYMKQVGAFGAVDRDPGERVISVAYCALIKVEDYDKKLLNAHNLEWIYLDELPKLYSDHNDMIKKALTLLRKRISTEPLSFNLLPDLFTLTQLQHVYEAVLGEEIDKRNFRKRIKNIDFIEKTDLIDKKTSKRGAALYRFNKKTYMEDPTFKL
ncbi:MAG: NUDIX domain-containing protein [Prevotellaceae bacterium]|nr:NUDIX domain-containing protein [Prevotellaceae bacterium]